MNILNLLNINFILNFIIFIAFTSISLIFLQKILHYKSTIEKNLLFIFINAIVFVLGNLLFTPGITCTLLIISSILSLCFLLKIFTEVAFVYASSASILIFNIYFAIFKILAHTNNYNSFNEIINLPICNLVTLGLITFLELSIFLKLKNTKIDKLLENSIITKSKLVIAMSSLNLILCSLIFAIFFDNIVNNILYFLGSELFFYITIAAIIHFCHSEYTHQRLNNLKLCNKTVLTLYDNTRAFKHDFHNIIQAIGGYIEINDMDGLKNYYRQVLHDCKIINSYSKLNPKLVNNPAIYNILADKYYIADQNDIKINLDVMLDLNKLNMNIYELTRILGILLDNAIEASKECEEKNINISFKQEKNKQLLIIENTYSNKQVSIDKIFEKDYTTKPHNTGLGLWEVKKILSKNSNLNLYTTKNDDYFSQQLEIYSA